MLWRKPSQQNRPLRSAVASALSDELLSTHMWAAPKSYPVLVKAEHPGPRFVPSSPVDRPPTSMP
jgi:hypothetical protein